jgi:hypothetical protein
LTCALHTNSIWLALAAIAPLASGCCLPELSGRCEPASAVCGDYTRPEVARGRAASREVHQHDDRHRDNQHAHHHADRHNRLNGFGHRLGVWQGPGIPPGEVVPLPEFHPVPTRPVFEPLPEYSPPAALARPLAPVITAPDRQLDKRPAAELLPTPAQPVPEAE